MGVPIGRTAFVAHVPPPALCPHARAIHAWEGRFAGAVTRLEPLTGDAVLILGLALAGDVGFVRDPVAATP